MSKNDFEGRLSQKYDRQYRLNGEWEMAVVSLRMEINFCAMIYCDLVGYSAVNNEQLQFLDFFNPLSTRNNSPRYVKVVKKRFNTINVDILKQTADGDHSSNLDVTCVLHFRKI